MKTRKMLFAIMGTLSLFASDISFAGNRPGAVTLTLGDGYYAFAAKRHIDNTGVLNGELGYNFTDHWAAEIGVGVINTDQKPWLGDAEVHGGLYTLDGLYRFSPRGMFEPYVSAGLGIINLSPNGEDSETQGNVNAGLGTQVFFSDSIALRGEVKDLYTMAGGKNDVMINAGVSFLFGGETSVPVSGPSYKGDS